ncbi:Hypothetical Protein FCC1311_105962 [Hondaea fermentalgiana]|uniref:Uncharacterized protein n=1 Tax=Hondaea fermentalgiana TaxID=2315210 RepID=A0A2R5H008_9STRA|nr:Hypothetical Protein FCC1311_105962 [Hondaea fermentalgiana]|eukprot:GBG34373.1 Hypothetical Protein FCC1311_105962 [Hondaea fermentalgiana]
MPPRAYENGRNYLLVLLRWLYIYRKENYPTSLKDTASRHVVENQIEQANDARRKLQILMRFQSEAGVTQFFKDYHTWNRQIMSYYVAFCTKYLANQTALVNAVKSVEKPAGVFDLENAARRVAPVELVGKIQHNVVKSVAKMLEKAHMKKKEEKRQQQMQQQPPPSAPSQTPQTSQPQMQHHAQHAPQPHGQHPARPVPGQPLKQEHHQQHQRSAGMPSQPPGPQQAHAMPRNGGPRPPYAGNAGPVRGPRPPMARSPSNASASSKQSAKSKKSSATGPSAATAANAAALRGPRPMAARPMHAGMAPQKGVHPTAAGMPPPQMQHMQPQAQSQAPPRGMPTTSKKASRPIGRPPAATKKQQMVKPTPQQQQQMQQQQKQMQQKQQQQMQQHPQLMMQQQQQQQQAGAPPAKMKRTISKASSTGSNASKKKKAKTAASAAANGAEKASKTKKTAPTAASLASMQRPPMARGPSSSGMPVNSAATAAAASTAARTGSPVPPGRGPSSPVPTPASKLHSTGSDKASAAGSGASRGGTAASKSKPVSKQTKPSRQDSMSSMSKNAASNSKKPQPTLKLDHVPLPREMVAPLVRDRVKHTLGASLGNMMQVKDPNPCVDYLSSALASLVQDSLVELLGLSRHRVEGEYQRRVYPETSKPFGLGDRLEMLKKRRLALASVRKPEESLEALFTGLNERSEKDLSKPEKSTSKSRKGTQGDKKKQFLQSEMNKPGSVHKAVLAAKAEYLNEHHRSERAFQEHFKQSALRIRKGRRTNAAARDLALLPIMSQSRGCRVTVSMPELQTFLNTEPYAAAPKVRQVWAKCKFVQSLET